METCKVGDRIIYKGRSFFSDWCEAIVMELSPDGQQIKLNLSRSDKTRYVRWEDVDDIREIKILAPRSKEGEGER